MPQPLTPAEPQPGSVFLPPPEPAPPKPLGIKLDKTMVFLQLPTFTEFAQDTPRLGDLLRTRYAETRVTADLQGLLATYPDILHIVALVTEEDPDTLAVAPIVARLFAGVARCDLRILRDDGDLSGLQVLARDLDLAAALEEWDLPQFLIFDEDWELAAQWGPRPAAAEARLDAWLGSTRNMKRLAKKRRQQPNNDTPPGHKNSPMKCVPGTTAG